MAGAGPDGALVYRMQTTHKIRLGRSAYYLRAAHLFATSRFQHFEVKYPQTGSTVSAKSHAVALMSARVCNLGGLFAGLTSRSASIEASELELHFVRRPAWLSLPLWFLSSWFGLQKRNPLLKHVRTGGFECKPLNEASIHVQADGEWIGRAPFRVSIVPDALLIRVPKSAAKDAG
jgi:diacylglycerol kinase family enzyme